MPIYILSHTKYINFQSVVYMHIEKYIILTLITRWFQASFLCNFGYRVDLSREIYSNSVPLSPPHWPYPKCIRPPSWPRVAVASSIQNTKLFTWRTWPGAGAVPKCDWAARSQSVSKQRRADHTKYLHLICCDAWPIRYHYCTDDCIYDNEDDNALFQVKLYGIWQYTSFTEM